MEPLNLNRNWIKSLAGTLLSPVTDGTARSSKVESLNRMPSGDLPKPVAGVDRICWAGECIFDISVSR
jgi:hypothetical protein